MDSVGHGRRGAKKKLTDAVAFWSRGGAASESNAAALDDLKAFGVEIGDQEPSGEYFELWEENATALNLFFLVASQWRLSANGAVLGLDYAGVESGWRMSGIPQSPELFADLRACERAATREFRSKR